MKFYLVALFLLLILTGYLVYHTSTAQSNAETAQIQEQIERERTMRESNQNYTARFLLFTNSTKRILSDKQYMLRWQGAYLTPEAPTQVSVSEEHVTWGMFFLSLDIQVNQTCLVIGEKQQFCNAGENTLKFYLNGEKDMQVLDKVIHDSDQLLVSYGAENQIELDKQLQAVNDLQK